MSDAGDGRGARRGSAREDEALVAALGRASRDVAASDGRAGPPPSVWHTLVRASAQRRSSPPWRSRARLWPWAAGAAFAAVAVLGVVRWRHGEGPADHQITAADGLSTGHSVSPLTFSVAGASLKSGEEIEAAGHSKAEIRFSDGTHVGLSDGARLAVAGRSADGAHLRLRSGRARFQVVHRPHAAWTVDAGPYLIEVTGTVFDVRWSETEQKIEVRMQSGSVRVSGPLLMERMPLRAGQHLVARPAEGDVRLDEGPIEGGRAPGEPGSDEAPPAPGSRERPATPGRANNGGGVERRATTPVIGAAAAAPSPDAPARPARVRAHLALARDPWAVRVPAREAERPERSATSGLPAGQVEPPPSLGAPSGSRPGEVQDERPLEGADAPPATAPRPDRPPNPWRQRRWSTKVAAGQSQAVIEDAERIGVEVTLAGADSQSLAALADAARYAGRPDLADRALVEERRRFPGGARAQAAAFLLGRAADDRGDIQGGLAWYRRYLTEAPRGPYAAEVLGREMLAVERLQGREAAVPLAAEYLRRFPNGTYLLRARSLLQTDDDRPMTTDR